MPIGSHDILMMIRARDQASHIITQVGTGLGALGRGGYDVGQASIYAGAALTGMGIAAGAAGMEIVDFYHDATMAAIDYQQTAALTLTQLDDTSVALQDIKDVGIDVANAIPAPFEEMQSSLYDIFSSMDVNVPQAELLLEQFSKGAVAGQVEVQDAARSTIAILNSFQLPVEDVNHVMDVQFQLVRKGIGTYGEFAEVMGRVTPAAAAANQSLETMSGAMAFLTRNGLSTAMASTSAARAMELFANPKTTANLEAMGIQVRDANGNFRQINDVIYDLANSAGWKNLTGPQLKEAFQDTFGTGSIQARRFFDLAIPNIDQLNSLIGDMHDSSGAMGAAYDIMFEQPQSQIQLLKNQWDTLIVQIGERFIPVLMSVVEWVGKAVDWFKNLSPETQDLIIKITAITGVALVVVGAIMAIIGAVLLFSGAMAIAGVGIGTVVVAFGSILAVIALLIAGLYALGLNWDTVKEKALQFWDWLGPKVEEGRKAMEKFLKDMEAGWNYYWPGIRKTAEDVWNAIVEAGQRFWAWVQETWPYIQAVIIGVWESVKSHADDAVNKIRDIWTSVSEFILMLWNGLQEWWNTNGQDMKQSVIDLWNAVVENVGPIIQELVETFNAAAERIKFIWNIIGPIIGSVLDWIKAKIDAFITVATWVWENWGQTIMSVVKIAWDWVLGNIQTAIGFISNVVQFFLNVFQGDWGEAWENVKNIVQIVWDAIQRWIEAGGGVIEIIWTKITDWLKSMWDQAWKWVEDTVKEKLKEIVRWIMGKKQELEDIWNGLPETLKQIGKDIIEGLWNGLKAKWDEVTKWFEDITNSIPDLKGPATKDAVILYSAGQLIMDGFDRGLKDGWKSVQGTLGDMTTELDSTFTGNPYMGAGGRSTLLPVGNGQMGGRSLTIAEGAVQVVVKDGTTENVRDGVQQALDQIINDFDGADE